jgi:hypothetical protein
MQQEKYLLNSDDRFLVFEFESVGVKGRIKKVVQYTQTNYTNFYNLGFGDKDEISGEFSDKTISNNGDSLKVLYTVVGTLMDFTSQYPEAWVYATGSTKSRTRLYRIGISNHLDAISKDFELFGLLNDEWQPFKRNTDYSAFLVRRM